MMNLWGRGKGKRKRAPPQQRKVSFRPLGHGSAMGSANRATRSTRRSCDSPSASATNHGCDIVLERYRSVACHPLGLPLLAAFNGKNPSELKCLAQDQDILPSTTGLDNVLSASVLEWRGSIRKSEDILTKNVAKKIEGLNGQLEYHAHSEVGLSDDGHARNPPRIDVLLSPSENKTSNMEESTPYAVIEFGLNGDQWSQKLDQNIKYLDKMVLGGLKPDTVRFDEPILCGVITIEDDYSEDDGSENRFEMKAGVFLCTRRDLDHDPSDPIKFRMSLLWQDKTSDLDSASKSFGRLLQVVHDFSRWVKAGSYDPGFQYLSSSCCKCTYKDGEQEYDVVLRNYDSRLRTTGRNPAVYLDPDCQQRGVVGQTNVVLNLFSEEDEALELEELNPLESALWDHIGKRSNKIISTPYRQGHHYAKTPASFLPIIQQLKKLHSLGYVHGDIRAYNTVFGDDPREGWLIDFDFGGKVGEAKYPQGYKEALVDGQRIGKEFCPIRKRDDWYALGTMIFQVHLFRGKRPDNYLDITDVWIDDGHDFTDQDIQNLEEFLASYKASSGPTSSFAPCARFQGMLNEVHGWEGKEEPEKTVVAATGTPAKKAKSTKAKAKKVDRENQAPLAPFAPRTNRYN